MKAVRPIVAIFLIVLVVGLGTACTGAKGKQGPMIVAMGEVDASGAIRNPYNVTSSNWNDAHSRYEISFTASPSPSGGFSYVFLITPFVSLSSRHLNVGAVTLSDRLDVYLTDPDGLPQQGAFSFMVLDPTP